MIVDDDDDAVYITKHAYIGLQESRYQTNSDEEWARQ